MNRDTLSTLIGDGRSRKLSNAEIADRVLALAEEDATWAKALSHPLRAGIMRLLRRDRSISPVVAARELEHPIGTVAYHFRQLDKLGYIEICDEIPRRGATEHVYRAVDTRAGTRAQDAAASSTSAAASRAHSGLSSRQPSSSRRSFQ